MPKSHRPYAPEFRRQMVEMVRSGRTPEELSREFEPTAQSSFQNAGHLWRGNRWSIPEQVPPRKVGPHSSHKLVDEPFASRRNTIIQGRSNHCPAADRTSFVQ